jgi:hypothetical protein
MTILASCEEALDALCYDMNIDIFPYELMERCYLTAAELHPLCRLDLWLLP